MQKAIRFSEGQLLSLSACARADATLAGYLYKRSSDTGKWQQRWFALYQNFLFYFENDTTMRPSGLALIEGCQCERVISTKGKDNEKQHLFSISYRQEGQRQYDLRADTEPDRESWVMAINRASYQVLSQQREELEQKYLHLLQIVESEKTAKWQLMQQCEEQSLEIRRLKRELIALRKDQQSAEGSTEEESDDIKKIKKVQSFLRGWLCRRRWKSIVQDYIRSPHAESMRKRNQIVFTMVECEEEYVTQLSTLVTCFLRPLKMSASSKKPPITHEDVNSIFLNSETIMFLHQIFYQGLRARMESWPTLVLGDLFDMLLPMLSIYQEYVRNHHYSLQVLAECKHQSNVFNTLLKQYEAKPICEGRTLETFLTYPMHQIPRYIITLNELLAHTPHDHVERKSLEFAQTKLEELSRVMQDEVSETENIRKSLSIERMIVDGCDILLDVNQTFVRQGTLVQLSVDRGRSSSRVRLSHKDKESARQCFLFSQHLIITTRGSGGKLYLSKVRKGGARISLMDATLTEDITEGSDEESTDSTITASENESLAFKLTVESKQGPPAVYVLMAATTQEKAAWCSDISQCIDNIHYHGLLNSATEDVSSVLMPQNIRTDARLFNDDVDIRFSRTLNSCKVPQIRYATVERLLERLTDLRFLSIDFLNTFLYTYRVFTSGSVVLEALIRVYRAPETCLFQHNRYGLVLFSLFVCLFVPRLHVRQRRAGGPHPGLPRAGDMSLPAQQFLGAVREPPAGRHGLPSPHHPRDPHLLQESALPLHHHPPHHPVGGQGRQRAVVRVQRTHQTTPAQKKLQKK
ncbi:ras-specific guanine nucleotide-releasing factor 1-like isoform X2 [Branchiostoma lanceolatum]|uniref:ras-specific guanine nucleotide-releasing factor 1-like isoform X2 n=1 Tax=Branchiostoma lanceolatum TaxID=7740 RepID=UPI0034540934